MSVAERILEGGLDIKALIMSQPRSTALIKNWDVLDWLAFLTETEISAWDWLDEDNDRSVYGYIPSDDGEHYTKTADVASFPDDQLKRRWRFTTHDDRDNSFRVIFDGSYTDLLNLYLKS